MRVAKPVGLMMAEPMTLNTLAAAYADCQRCALAASRRRVVFGSGSSQAPLLVLAERIGGTDEEVGRPFSGPAGEMLRRILAAPGVEIPLEQIYITNLVLCRAPGDRSPRVSEMRACQERLGAEVGLVGPQLLVIMGRLPLHYFLGGKVGLERQRGWWPQSHLAHPVPAYVTFNPASALYGDAHAIRRKKLLIYEDWQAIGAAYRALDLPT